MACRTYAVPRSGQLELSPDLFVQYMAFQFPTCRSNCFPKVGPALCPDSQSDQNWQLIDKLIASCKSNSLDLAYQCAHLTSLFRGRRPASQAAATGSPFRCRVRATQLLKPAHIPSSLAILQSFQLPPPPECSKSLPFLIFPRAHHMLPQLLFQVQHHHYYQTFIFNLVPTISTCPRPELLSHL